MKRKASDISLLLTILVLFSASIGLLHGFKFTLVAAEATPASRIGLGLQDAFDANTLLLQSDNMDKVAKTLQQYDANTRQRILDDLLLDGKELLSDAQKIKLLIGCAKYSQDDQPTRDRYFDLLAEHFSDKPVLAYFVDEYVGIIPVLKRWAKQKRKKELFARWKGKSLVHIVEMNDPSLLEQLYIHDIRFTPKEASLLLDSVVSLQKDPAFVPLLIEKFHADPNFSSDGKRTVLMKAVSANNSGLVRVLANRGADAHRVLDSDVGSANQIAQENKLDEIIRILMNY